MASLHSPQIFTADELAMFLDAAQTSAEVLAALVSADRRRTELSLGRLGPTHDYVACLLEVLIKASQCGSDATGVIDLLTLVVGSRFFTHELISASSSMLNGSTSEECTLKFIQNLVDILHHVSLRLPNSFTNAFGLVIILQKRTEEMLLTAKGEERKYILGLSDQLSDMRDSVMKRMVKYSSEDSQLPCERQAPPEDFRTIPILPRISDIFLSSRSTFLRKNKARGGYDNLHHYLDVQFRLYREDCISPLREGITQYVQEASAGHSVGRLQDGRLYKNVQIQFLGHGLDGEIYSAALDPGHAGKINWMTSRRLMYGSLLCLSADNFHTMYFAVVTESDRHALSTGHTFKIAFPSAGALPLNRTFTMVESTAYFEAYRHVLIGLQNIEEGELPFEHYIVDCKKDVGPPLYLHDALAKYDLQPMLTGELIFKNKRQIGLYAGFNNIYVPDKVFEVGIHSPSSEWPSADDLHLDQSQFEAFHAALTQEFVLIQGPPGTGKTHVGLQIAKTLLHNRDVWCSRPSGRLDTRQKSQLLVVCFTNHALDQFMEGIVNFLDKGNKSEWKRDIVRVGGQCKSVAIEEFALKNRRRIFDNRADTEHHTRLTELEKMFKEKHQRIAVSTCCLRNLHRSILYFELLEPVMSEKHARNFDKTPTKISSERLFQWLQADAKTWLRNANESYNKHRKSHSSSTSKMQRAEQDHIEYTEFKTIDDERHVEEDNLGMDFSVDVGLSVQKAIDKLLEPHAHSKQHLDDQLTYLLQKEAGLTKSCLESDDMMSDREVESLTKSLWKLPVQRRWKLYRYWVDKYKKFQMEILPGLDKEYLQAIRAYQRAKTNVDMKILAQSTVIAMTTTGAARYQDVLKDIGPRIVIVEEAAEVLEAHIVTALSSRCEHLILIGDHKQLEPKPSVMQLALKYNLSLSMFERMLNNGIANHCLQRQHRMRPEISTLVRDIYPVLEDNENVFLYDHILGVKKDVFFLNHNQPEDYADDIRSYSNQHEARFVSELCRYLLKQGYSGSQITILAAYTGQMFCIRECMPRREFEGIRTAAIDNFQGEENDIIILSLVRSNNERKIGFMSRENRMCVALSRAKKGLYVIGNFNLFESASCRWANVVHKIKKSEEFGTCLPLYCQNHPSSGITEVTNPEDFAKSPEGGCDLPCDFRLPCGHTCRHHCHPLDRYHTEYLCHVICGVICPNGHLCKRECHSGEQCHCPAIMKKELSCGHSATMQCWESPDDFQCNITVEKLLPCGHSLTRKCHVVVSDYKCIMIVKRTLQSCAHKAYIQCDMDPDKYKCQIMVKRVLPTCSHEAKMICSKDPEKYACPTKVTRILSKCGHEAEMECWTRETDCQCSIQVTRTREKCGHSYIASCWVDSSVFQSSEHCTEIVTQAWECGHTEDTECWKKTSKCDVAVEKTMPCGHVRTMKCYIDPKYMQCNVMINKTLPECGHVKLIECCNASVPEFCQTVVSKTIAKCGHTQEMKCYMSPLFFVCNVIVEKTHPRCGHTVELHCSGQLHRYSTCQAIVGKMLPCGHEKQLECSESEKCYGNVNTCHEKVLKKLPMCEHMREMLCSEIPTNTKCREKVEIIIPKCGHKASVSCYKKPYIDGKDRTVIIGPNVIPVCREPMWKEFPCGHSTTAECHNFEAQTCHAACSDTLSCGHACPGTCYQCTTERVHMACERPCSRTLICGHQCKSLTCGSCRLCFTKCDRYCPHRACAHPCNRECTPCTRECSWQCPHYTCTRSCFEECDRPRCDRRCEKVLECTHQCMGFCGEPCPELCDVCEPRQLEGKSVVLLEDCGHEFDAVYLDRHFEELGDAFSLLQCPLCESVLKCHPRYNTLLKKQWKYLDIMKKYLSSSSDIGGRYPMVMSGVSDIVKYVQKFNTFLYLQENLISSSIADTQLSQMSTSIMDKTTARLSVFPLKLASHDVHNINQYVQKLSAVWLLFICNCQNEERPSDVDSDQNDDDDGDECETAEYPNSDKDISLPRIMDIDANKGQQTPEDQASGLPSVSDSSRRGEDAGMLSDSGACESEDIADCDDIFLDAIAFHETADCDKDDILLQNINSQQTTFQPDSYDSDDDVYFAVVAFDDDHRNAAVTILGAESTVSTAVEEMKVSTDVEETEVNTAVEETEVSTAVEETKVNTAVEETEVNTAVEETEVSTAVEETKVNTAVEETEVSTAVEETKVNTAVEETEVSTVAEETEVSTAVEETKVNTAVEETEVSTAVVETKVNTAVEETEVNAAVEETKVNTAVEETEVSTAVVETKVNTAVEETEVSTAVEETNVNAAVEETKVSTAVEETKVNPAVEETNVSTVAEETNVSTAAEESKVSTAVEETEVSTNDEQSNDKTSETRNKTCMDVENFIVNSHQFTAEDLQTVRLTLEPLLRDVSETIPVLDCPSLWTIDVHRGDWNICPKGHVTPMAGTQDLCNECVSGTPFDVTFQTLLNEMRDQQARRTKGAKPKADVSLDRNRREQGDARCDDTWGHRPDPASRSVFVDRGKQIQRGCQQVSDVLRDNPDGGYPGLAGRTPDSDHQWRGRAHSRWKYAQPRDVPTDVNPELDGRRSDSDLHWRRHEHRRWQNVSEESGGVYNTVLPRD